MSSETIDVYNLSLEDIARAEYFDALSWEDIEQEDRAYFDALERELERGWEPAE